MNQIQGLFEQLLYIHEVDRYPTPELSLIKLQEEVGELASAWLENDFDKVTKEAADVVFALQGFVRIWNIDLITEMQKTIERSSSKKKKEGKHSNA